MTTPEGPVQPEEPWQDEEDRLNDQAGSFDTARRWRGEGTAADIRAADPQPTPEKSKKKPLSSTDRRRIGAAATGPQYGEEAGVGYPGGIPPEHQDFPKPTVEEAARNSRFAKNWREIGEQARRDGTHGVEDTPDPEAD